jgi:hypothetical protein
MSSFNRRWYDAAEENNDKSFSERWDFTTEHSTEPPNEAASASDVILDVLRTKRQSETGRWLHSLIQQVTKPAPETVAPKEQTRAQENATGVLLDKMFNEFQKYAASFNQTVQGTDFVINCHRPTYVYELANKYPYNGDIEPGKITTFEGHLATRYWAMLLRGQYGKIEIFITPAKNLLGFNAQNIKGAAIAPYMSIDAVWKDGSVIWQIYGEEMSLNAIAPLTKELFGDLLKVASGSMSEADIAAKQASKVVQDSPSEGKTVIGTPEFSVNNLNTLKTVQLSKTLIAAVEFDIQKLVENSKQALESNDKIKMEELGRLITALEHLLTSFRRFIKEIKQISDR